MSISGIGFLVGEISGFFRMPAGVYMDEPIPAGMGVKDLKVELAKFGVTAHIVDVEPPDLVTFRVRRQDAKKAQWAIQQWNQRARQT